jgi:hypothetical protein
LRIDPLRATSSTYRMMRKCFIAGRHLISDAFTAPV